MTTRNKTSKMVNTPWLRTAEVVSRRLSMLLLAAAVAACAVPPIAAELPRVPLNPLQAPTDPTVSRVVFRNNQPMPGYHLSPTGRLNVSVDGKGLGQIAPGEYVALDLPKGKRRVSLVHRDVVDFKSEHVLTLEQSVVVVDVFATITSNSMVVVDSSPSLSGYSAAR
jgi:hypothetical protein